MSLQARETKGNIKKWDYIKLKSFLYMKETINKMKRLPTESVMIFANDISDKGLISKYTKNAHYSTSKKETS